MSKVNWSHNLQVDDQTITLHGHWLLLTSRNSTAPSVAISGPSEDVFVTIFLVLTTYLKIKPSMRSLTDGDQSVSYKNKLEIQNKIKFVKTSNYY